MKCLVSFIALLVLVSVSIAANSLAQTNSQSTEPHYGNLSLRLKQGMSEQEVLNALGQPTNTKLSTSCGRLVGQPYTCQIWVYGHFAINSVVIYFDQSPTGSWAVMAWHSGQ
jgi:hypothetical protein